MFHKIVYAPPQRWTLLRQKRSRLWARCLLCALLIWLTSFPCRATRTRSPGIAWHIFCQFCSWCSDQRRTFVVPVSVNSGDKRAVRPSPGCRSRPSFRPQTLRCFAPADRLFALGIRFALVRPNKPRHFLTPRVTVSPIILPNAAARLHGLIRPSFQPMLGSLFKVRLNSSAHSADKLN